MQEGQAAAPQGAPEAQAKGPGIAEAIVQGDKILATIAKAVVSNPQLPPELKEQAQALSEGYRQFTDALLQAAQSAGGAPQAAPQGAPGPAPGGAPVAQEAGAGRAVPVTPGGMRR
jgi:hypothetical protein